MASIVKFPITFFFFFPFQSNWKDLVSLKHLFEYFLVARSKLGRAVLAGDGQLCDAGKCPLGVVPVTANGRS